MSDHRALRLSKALLIFEHEPADFGDSNMLVSEIGVQSTSDLYRALSLDTVERFAGLPIAHTIVFARNNERAEELRSLYQLLDIQVQAGDNPAERLMYAFEDAFDAGYRQILLVSSLAATLPQRIVESGLTLLDAFDDAVVLGPCPNGWYYSIGMRRPYMELFDYLDFPGGGVYDETVRRISAIDSALYLLPSWRGMTTVEHLQRLSAEVKDRDPQSALLRHTATVLPTIDYPLLFANNA